MRDGNWTIAPIPADLQCRRVEITGPVERKMVINALNSGADAYMTDFEDSNAPNWDNQITGQLNLIDAIRRTISLEQGGKTYKLNDKVATLVVRPRGWHLDEKHVLVDGQRVSGGIFDFALFMFHNAKELIARGSGPYFYLPKMESHLEARLWNDIFVMTQKELGIPQGTIKATVLIETILAAFEMDEILYELREHSAGLNAGRWDYIFSCIKKFKVDKNFCLADRATGDDDRALHALVRAAAACDLPPAQCAGDRRHERADPDQERSRRRTRRRSPAFAPTRPATPPTATTAAGSRIRGWCRSRWRNSSRCLGRARTRSTRSATTSRVTAADLLNFQPETPITEAGLRMNINVGIHYLGSWLAGNGCVPIHDLMEDAATAEISRSQVWQWIRSPKGKLDDGRKVTAEMVRALIPEELAKVKAAVGPNSPTYDRAAQIFEQMSTQESFAEFLTLPLYEEIA